MKGTPPVTFKWYRSGQEKPLHTTTAYKNNTDFQISRVSKEHSDSYHCEAFNYANLILSQPVLIQGETGRQNHAHSATYSQDPLRGGGGGDLLVCSSVQCTWRCGRKP